MRVRYRFAVNIVRVIGRDLFRVFHRQRQLAGCFVHGPRTGPLFWINLCGNQEGATHQDNRGVHVFGLLVESGSCHQECLMCANWSGLSIIDLSVGNLVWCGLCYSRTSAAQA